MEYMSTDFGVDSSSHFPHRAQYTQAHVCEVVYVDLTCVKCEK